MPHQERKAIIGTIENIKRNRDCEFIDINVQLELKPRGWDETIPRTIHIARPVVGRPIVLKGDTVKVSWLTKNNLGPVRMKKLERG